MNKAKLNTVSIFLGCSTENIEGIVEHAGRGTDLHLRTYVYMDLLLLSSEEPL